MSVIVVLLLYAAIFVVGLLLGIIATVLTLALCGIGAMFMAVRIPEAQADLTDDDDVGLDITTQGESNDG